MLTNNYITVVHRKKTSMYPLVLYFGRQILKQNDNRCIISYPGILKREFIN